MKYQLLKTVLILFTLHFSLLIAYSQTWQECHDSSFHYFHQGNHKEAVRWGDKALKFDISDTSVKVENQLNLISALSASYQALKDIQSAISVCEMGLSLTKDKDEFENWHFDFLFKYASTYMLADSIELAEKYFNEAIKFHDNLKEPHPGFWHLYKEYAKLRNHQRKFEQAKEFYDKATEVVLNQFGEDSKQYVDIIQEISLHYWQQQNFRKAKEYIVKQLDFFRKNHESYRKEYASRLHYLGNANLRLSHFKEAIKDLEMSDSLRKIHWKTDQYPGKQSIMGLLAYAYEDLGNYRKAEETLLEIIDFFEKNNDTDTKTYWAALANLASLYLNLGRYDESEKYYKTIINDYYTTREFDSLEYSLDLSNLGVLYYYTNRDEEAEKIFDKVIGIRRRMLDPNSPYLADCYNNQALVYKALGKLEQARDLFLETKKIYESNKLTKHMNYAQFCSNVAALNDKLKKHDEAEKLFKQVVDFYEEKFSVNHPKYTESIFHLFKHYYRRGKYEIAQEYFSQSVDKTMDLIKRNFRYATEKDKINFRKKHMAKINEYYLYAHDYYDKIPELTSYFYDIIIAMKGIVISSQERALNEAKKDSITYNKWLDSKKKWMAYFQNPKMAKNRGIDIDSLEKAANNYERELAEISSAFMKNYDTLSITWRDISKVLKSGEAAVEIVRFNIVDKDKNTSFYVALIVKDNTKDYPEIVVLDTSHTIESEHILRYKKLIEEQLRSQNGQKVISSAGEVKQKTLEDLYNVFWKKIDNKLTGIDKVFFAPDGAYHKINLNTLINPGTGKYLLEEIDICLLTNTKDLVEWQRHGREVYAHKNAYLVGNPTFDLTNVIASADKIQIDNELRRNFEFIPEKSFKPLPGTEKEVMTISESLSEKNWNTQTFLGSQALESNIKKLKDPRVLHLATHGIFLEKAKRLEDIAIEDYQKTKYSKNPLLRSILLLAGAQNTVRGEPIADKDDGILSAYEVMNMDLDNTELVVLSACETGLGEVKNGEGVFGMQRAFQMAGAKTLIMSLWSVSDEATQQLMINFYNNWLSGQTKREAFRQAQIDLKKKYKDFYYWGGFVMVGE